MHTCKRQTRSPATFPQVRLVRERATGSVYAMKKLKKAEMVRRGQVEHVKAEQTLLAEVSAPCVVKLFYSFQVSRPPPFPFPPPPPTPHSRAFFDPGVTRGDCRSLARLSQDWLEPHLPVVQDR